MKKYLLFSVFFCLCSAFFAQVSVDPSDNFYRQVERWETLGIIEKQHSLRPYPLPVVEKILKSVIETESQNESSLAKQIYEEVFNRSWKLLFEGSVYGAKKESFSKRAMAKYGVEGDISFLNVFSAGWQLDFLSDLFPETSVLPEYQYFPYFFADGRGSKLKNYMECDGNLAIKINGFYFQTGLNHNSFGNFYEDSLTLNPSAKHSANFVLSYMGKNWNYTQGVFCLTATRSSENILEDPGKYPFKYLMMHSVDWNISKKISLSFYESIIYGQKFNISFAVPMLYMVTQGVTGYSANNLFMGGSFVYSPVPSLSFNGDLYLDDIGFTGLKEYKDIKLHCAGALGVKYVPENNSVIQLVKAGYTLVTPFMYSHCHNDDNGNAVGMGDVNYQIYTTGGTPLGSNLPPNSDRIALKVELAPVSGLSVKVGGAFIRHGNVTESLTKEEQISLLASPAGFYATDGSINQHSAYGENGDTKKDRYMDSADNRTMILTQPTKEYTFQTDIEIGWKLPPSKAGKFEITAGYTFEYIKNYGVGNEMLAGKGWKYDSKNQRYYENYDSSKGIYTGEIDVESELAKAFEDWKSQLKNVMNHYLTVKFKYSY